MDFNLVMPMAGAGSRFIEAGYKDPKPLILVKNVFPMFKLATDNILDSLSSNIRNLIYIIDADQEQNHRMSSHIHLFYPKAKIITLSERTKGAACTVRAAGAFLEPDVPVIVANCDQYFTVDETAAYKWDEFMTDYEAGILVFDSPDRNTKWSYAEIDKSNHVIRVAEKDPISDMATVGIYYWNTASKMFNSIGAMMLAGDMTNGEYYLCPAFNYTIKHGYKVGIYKVKTMHGLGTPEDLEQFQEYQME